MQIVEQCTDWSQILFGSSPLGTEWEKLVGEIIHTTLYFWDTLPGHKLPRQMSTCQLAFEIHGPKNLPLKFCQQSVTNSEDIRTNDARTNVA